MERCQGLRPARASLARSARHADPGPVHKTRTKARKKPNGPVALVAAGPGDPDLLTLRAAALLRDAEYIVVDADAAEVAAVHASPEAEVIIAVSASGLPLEHAERAKLVIDGQTVAVLGEAVEPAELREALAALAA